MNIVLEQTEEYVNGQVLQWSKSPKKQSVGVYMALYFECGIDKNSLLQTVFWQFCPLAHEIFVGFLFRSYFFIRNYIFRLG